MRLSLQAQYAICGIFDLAYNGQEAPVQVRVVGERQKIPARYLEQIFQRLRKAKLVRGKRGPGGGYVLARPAGEIRLLDVIEAVEGPFERMVGTGPPPRERKAPYRPDFLWEELGASVAEVFAEITLEALCRRAARRAVRRAESSPPMYHI